ARAVSEPQASHPESIHPRRTPTVCSSWLPPVVVVSGFSRTVSELRTPKVDGARATAVAWRACYDRLCERCQNMDDPARALPECAVGDVDANQHEMRIGHTTGKPRLRVGFEQLAHFRTIGHERGGASQLEIPVLLLVLKGEIDAPVVLDLADLVTAFVGEEPERAAKGREITLQPHRTHVELAGWGSRGHQHRRTKARQKGARLRDGGVGA